MNIILFQKRNIQNPLLKNSLQSGFNNLGYLSKNYQTKSEKEKARGRSCITATIPLPRSARVLNVFINPS